MQYDLLISLTTWKGRIYNNDFLKVIMAMISQKTQYKYKIVLVLSTDEFTNKEKDLPKRLLQIEKLCNNFEILWTKENTRAYKKYFPTRRAYPDENIVTIDDDTLLHSNFVETMVNLVKANPNKIILGMNPGIRYNGTIAGVRWGGACFPPNSLYDLDETFGRKYFHEHDDEFYVLLSVLNATHYVGINLRKIADVDKFQQNKKLINVVKMDYGHLKELWDNFHKENPKLSEQFNKNKLIKN